MTTNAEMARIDGWTYWQSKHGHYHVTSPEGVTSEPRFGYPAFDSETGKKIVREPLEGADIPDYLNSPADVIRLLEKQGMVEINKMHRMYIGWQWEVKVWEDGKSYFPKGEGEGPTFCAAACEALARANGGAK